jgi:hypothetical protein
MRFDFLFDSDNDLKIKDGDFVIGQSDAQHIEHLIVSAPLDWKEFPLLGASVEKFLHSNDVERLKRGVIEVLKSDGYFVKRLAISSDFEIDLEVR